MSKSHDLIDKSTNRNRGPRDNWAERYLGIESRPMRPFKSPAAQKRAQLKSWRRRINAASAVQAAE